MENKNHHRSNDTQLDSRWDTLTQNFESKTPDQPQLSTSISETLNTSPSHNLSASSFEDHSTPFSKSPNTLPFKERYQVNSRDFPIFNRHSRGEESWNIIKTLSTYTTLTADIIAEMDGTSIEYDRHPEREKPDYVIYLDKSARPVSWLVNNFWQDMSKEKRPDIRYLAIDRMPWYRRVDIPMDVRGYLDKDYTDGEDVRVNFTHFLRYASDEKLKSSYAGIRALFIQNGIQNEDIQSIMETPTILDGKNIMIVDEVSDTGSTMEIAKYLLRKAIPEIKSITGQYFWRGRTNTGKMTVPTWYNSAYVEGRGIGDVDQQYFIDRYQKSPTPRNRARKLGALVLGRPIHFAHEKSLPDTDENPSRQLLIETRLMRDQLRAGKIPFIPPMNYDEARFDQILKAQNIEIDPNPSNQNSLLWLRQNILDQK